MNEQTEGPTIQLRLARVVKFSETKYTKEGISLDFLIDVFRFVILEDDVAIDILNHNIYQIVPLIDGAIPIDYLGNLDRNSLYVYQQITADYSENQLEEILRKALAAYQWYHEEYKKREKKKCKIFSFEEGKKRFEKKRNERKS